MRLRPQICLVLLIAFAVPAASAQDAPAPEPYPQVEMGGTQVRTLTSSIVEDQEYELHVSLPRSYGDEETRSTYPVLYVLDGQWDFPLVASIYGGQYYDGFVPEIIIVGLTWGGDDPDVDSLRARDFTPTRTDQMPHTGGASSFLAFLKDELIPFVEAEYPVRPDDRALMGSSFGGLFTLYALFHEPTLFDHYVASAPALQWDDGITYTYENDYAAQHSDLPARVYMVLGEHENVDAFEQFADTLRGRGYGGLDLETRVIDEMGHSGHKPEGFTRAMRYVYKRPSLSLPADLLDDYVGTYRLGDQVQVEIWREDDHLIARQNGGEETRLHAQTETTFYLPGSYLFIHFKRQEGKVVGFDVETYSDEFFLERVKG